MNQGADHRYTGIDNYVVVGAGLCCGRSSDGNRGRARRYKAALQAAHRLTSCNYISVDCRESYRLAGLAGWARHRDREFDQRCI